MPSAFGASSVYVRASRALVVDETDLTDLGSQGTFRGLVDSHYERWGSVHSLIVVVIVIVIVIVVIPAVALVP